jgi:hypothetical protein
VFSFYLILRSLQVGPRTSAFSFFSKGRVFVFCVAKSGLSVTFLRRNVVKVCYWDYCDNLNKESNDSHELQICTIRS